MESRLLTMDIEGELLKAWEASDKSLSWREYWLTAQDTKSVKARDEEIQTFIDENNIYQVEFGHYEVPLKTKWVPLKTHRVNIVEDIKCKQ